MSAVPNIAPRLEADTAETIGRLLVDQGVISDKQLKHAKRVRSKLAQTKTLLNTMLELEYFSAQQFNDTLRASSTKSCTRP